MRNARNALIIVLAISGVAAVAANYGIEVLGIEVLETGALAVQTGSVAPAGAYVEAVMIVGGQPYVVDQRPVGAGGLATVHFPGSYPGNHVALRDGSGVLLDTANVEEAGGYSSEFEMD